MGPVEHVCAHAVEAAGAAVTVAVTVVSTVVAAGMAVARDARAARETNVAEARNIVVGMLLVSVGEAGLDRRGG